LEGHTTSHPKNRDQSGLASDSINSLLSRGTQVVVPDICFGELVQVVGEKKLEVDFGHLLRELGKGRLVVRHVGEKDLMHYSNLVPKIWKADRLLESTDVRIIALSIADRECRGLLTFEKKLIESAGLRKFIAKEVTFKKSYLISDDPFRR
jgi:hypothetical protein